MANHYGNPWVIDTLGSLHYDGVTRPIAIRMLTFRGYGTATDKAVVQDANSDTIFELVGNAGLTPVSFYPGDVSVPLRGLSLTTLDSGRLLVFVE